MTADTTVDQMVGCWDASKAVPKALPKADPKVES